MPERGKKLYNSGIVGGYKMATQEEKIMKHTTREAYVNATGYDALPGNLRAVADKWKEDVFALNEAIPETGPLMVWVKLVYDGNVYEIEAPDIGMDTSIFMDHAEELASRLVEAGCSAAEPMVFYD